MPKECAGLPAEARVGWGARRVRVSPMKARAGWRVPAETYGYPLPKARAGRGMPAEARYLEHERQGRGNKFPLPVSPSPRGDIHTVQCQGINRKRTWHGGLPAPPRIRLLTRYTPGHGPRPQEGAGWGCRRTPHPSSNDVTPKISSRGRSGAAFVYIRAVSKTGAIPCRRASATAAAFGSGTSR